MKYLNKIKYFQNEDIEHNVNAVKNTVFPMYTDEKEPNTTLLTRYNLMADKIWEIIQQIPPLKTNKIVKGLGAGGFSLTYLLDNDHVLKLFLTGRDGPMAEIKKFRLMQKRQEQGIATKNEPLIFDIGSADISNAFLKQTYEGRDGFLYYVEMIKVWVMDDWIAKTQQDDDQWLDFFMDLTYYLTSYSHDYGIDGYFTRIDKLAKRNPKDELPDNVNKSILNAKSIAQLDRNILIPLVKDAYEYYKVFKTTDFHAGNIGIVFDEEKKPNFIFFDV